jgi:NADH-quinone oxidoreductase subunit K
MIGLGHYLTVAAILFTLGVLGIFVNRKNVIVGQVFALLVLTVAAAEAAIGLAILVTYFRNRGTIAVEDINLMKG